MYQVGDIEMLAPDDPVFETLEQATGYALMLSNAAIETLETAFIGIWDDDNNYDLVAIVLDAEVFRK